MRIVVALGGNALLERGERPDAAIQRRHVQAATAALLEIATEHELVICHGNGPQVGVLAVESAADPALTQPYPLDVLVAQTQGMIGYWLAQELRNADVPYPIACLITQTVVDAADPAFRRPTKPVGQVYDEATARALARQNHWSIAPDGTGWRRVVASPQPIDIVELPLVEPLLRAGAVVILGGGGGAPVVQTRGQLIGVEAVVDKDLAAALLATRLHADRLLILTDVASVVRDFGSDHATPIGHITADGIGQLDFASGSMAPKIAACVRFTTSTGNTSAIGSLTDARKLLAGVTGTQIVAASG